MSKNQLSAKEALAVLFIATVIVASIFTAFIFTIVKIIKWAWN